jgi:hypothetical protein
MQNQTQSEILKARKAPVDTLRPQGQPLVVMATLGAEDVDANGATCEPSARTSRSRTR